MLLDTSLSGSRYYLKHDIRLLTGAVAGSSSSGLLGWLFPEREEGLPGRALLLVLVMVSVGGAGACADTVGALLSHEARVLMLQGYLLL